MSKTDDDQSRPVAGPVERPVRPHGCLCDFRTYMVGDGCFACNPKNALDYLRDTVDDQAEEIDRLRAALKQCADAIEWDRGKRPHNLSTIGRAYWKARLLSAVA